ncbi:uncharacterized protein LOC125943608 [Dermacentor silvarum]|uniref:uncharacterized protein LOC125943608 n=1 Tax=Dermacentor silvarum TaxID=543639 RepID=UPI002100842E|nr:uncharacterized protein LOC125943608 [Dermacentor silvarum]
MAEIRGCDFPFVRVQDSYFCGDSCRKGAGLYESGHVHDVKGIWDNPVRISAKCVPQTSVTKPSYEVEFVASVPDFLLQDALCTCKAGKGGRCKHIAAVVHYINNEENRSCTTAPRLWGKPSVRALGTYKKGSCLDGFVGKPVEDVVQLPPDVPPSQDATVLAELLDVLWDHDCSLVTAIKHELSVTIPKHAEQEVLVHEEQSVKGHFRFSELHRGNGTQHNTDEEMCSYMANIVMTAEEIADTEKKTRDPGRDMVHWKEMRASRISASSRPHDILHSRKAPNVLAESFLSAKSFYSQATAYGIALEDEAISCFAKSTGAEIRKCGLHLMLEQPWLCCTLDAVVLQGSTLSLLEVKCLYSCKDKAIVDSNAAVSNVLYLVFRYGSVELKSSHKYYTQVQTSLYVLGLNK